MLRVLLLTTDLNRGGLPNRLLRLVPRLRQSRIEPLVGCLSPEGPVSAELRACGFETFSCDAAHRFDVSCLARLSWNIRRRRVDVVHASLFHANLAARLVGRLDQDRPIITSTVTIEIERRWHVWIESLTGDRSDVHVANSQAVADHLRDEAGFDPSRIVVIPNGIDFEEVDRRPAASRSAAGLEPDVPLVVWAGRMDPVKDLDTFVETVDRLRRKRRIRALLLGDGPMRGPLTRLVAARGLNGVITLALWSDDVIGWLKSADVLLLPSLTEGSPNVVLEAMAAGCPVVAGDIPACRELAPHRSCALLCPVGDAGAFCEAVCTVLDDRALADRLRQAARRRVETRHNLREIAGLWVRIYEAAVRR